MKRDADIADLKLIVRALHQDVSTLDERLRYLESQILELRQSMLVRADHVVSPWRTQARGA